MFPYKHSEIAKLSGQITPLNYSFSVTKDEKELLKSFLRVHGSGQMEGQLNIKFLKYQDPIPSAMFMFQDYFLILINSTVTDTGLKLELPIMKPIVYNNLFIMIMMGLFGEFSLFCGHIVLKYSYNNIIHTKKHLWNHQPFGICIYPMYSSYFILLNEDVFPQMFTKKFSTQNEKDKRLFSLTLQQATNSWINGKLTNFEYLLYVNGEGSRSFSDLSQYPTMPWIISDYDSYNLPPKLRDLSKPMGCITDARDEIFETNYEESNEYFYPCHYSYGAAVHFFLYRTPLFTYFEWDLHQGWDNPNRVFHSFSSTWKSVSEIGRNDVKELIPEAFFVPELFQNINSFNFTNVENNIVDVTIPPFCFSMQHFILSNRAALNASDRFDLWCESNRTRCNSKQESLPEDHIS